MKAIYVFLGILAISTALPATESIHEFTMDAINGQPVELADYSGKVVLLVNVASKCGFTPQYEGLESLYSNYKDRGLVVMGFPANNFGEQEPGTNEEIMSFCQRTYGVTFPMFSKISVKGDDQTPLYKFLTDTDAKPQTGGEVKWNFTKFLAGKNGKIIARFESKVTPDSQELVNAIEKALAR